MYRRYCQYNLRDNNGECIGHYVGLPDWRNPHAWLLDPDGKELASLAAEYGPPSEPPLKFVSASRFLLCIDGTPIGAMDSQMLTVQTLDGRERLLIEKAKFRREFTLRPAAQPAEDSVDDFTWFGIMGTLCHWRFLKNDTNVQAEPRRTSSWCPT